jgi:hypothetical protein
MTDQDTRSPDPATARPGLPLDRLVEQLHAEAEAELYREDVEDLDLVERAVVLARAQALATLLGALETRRLVAATEELAGEVRRARRTAR